MKESPRYYKITKKKSKMSAILSDVQTKSGKTHT